LGERAHHGERRPASWLAVNNFKAISDVGKFTVIEIQALP
jgi:hypothetical protein